MSDEQIIASMVKGRESCRQLVRAFETARSDKCSGDGANDNVSLLDTADKALERMLNHFKELPDKVGDTVRDVKKRE